jgi:hypothetical protein
MWIERGTKDMRRLLITAGAALTLLAGCGGDQLGPATGGGASTYTPPTGTGTGTTVTYEMGNGTGSSFQPGMIGLSTANVAAGGTTTLTITVVDQTGVLFTAAPVIVTYSSTCISNGQAVIAPSGTTSTAGTEADTVTSSTGTIDAIYTAKGCIGEDVITATATVGSDALTAYGTVTVAG